MCLSTQTKMIVEDSDITILPLQTLLKSCGFQGGLFKWQAEVNVRAFLLLAQSCYPSCVIQARTGVNKKDLVP